MRRRRNTTPVIQHEREPNAPLPLPGCHCEACENARDDAHGAKIGSMLGMPADDGTPAADPGDTYDQLMRRG
jgi:hypothetical protein